MGSYSCPGFKYLITDMARYCHFYYLATTNHFSYFLVGEKEKTHLPEPEIIIKAKKKANQTIVKSTTTLKPVVQKKLPLVGMAASQKINKQFKKYSLYGFIAVLTLTVIFVLITSIFRRKK